MKYILSIGLILILFTSFSFAQNDIQVGSNIDQQRINSSGALFDYSDPTTVNIKVAVWGFVKYPGRYIIPAYSNVNDLLSYAGGPDGCSAFCRI